MEDWGEIVLATQRPEYFSQYDLFRYQPPEPGTPIPEPSTVLLLGFGIVGMGVLGRKKLKK